MIKTTANIYLDINDSDYIVSVNDYNFYFSSEFYRDKFLTIKENYVELENKKLKTRLNVNVDFNLIFLISLYKKIEKRGFKIINNKTNKEIKANDIFIDIIKDHS